MKKISIFILAIVMLFTSNNIFVWNVEASESGSCGDGVVWNLKDDGVLSIGGSGRMDDYFGAGLPPWDKMKDNIKEVVIENGVTSIGSAAFFNYPNIMKITLGNDVKKIGDYAFFNCLKITDINWNACDVDDFGSNKIFDSIGTEQNGITVIFGENVNSIPANAFNTVNSPNIKKIVIGDNVSIIKERAFMNCFNVTDVTIGKNVKEIRFEAFWRNKNLSDIYWNAVEVYDFSESDSTFMYVGEEAEKGLCVHVGSGVQYIPANLFFAEIDSIHIPKSVDKIGVRPFSNIGEIENVYYEGSKSEFTNVVNADLLLLSQTNVHYRSYGDIQKQEQKKEQKEESFSFEESDLHINIGESLILTGYFDNLSDIDNMYERISVISSDENVVKIINQYGYGHLDIIALEVEVNGVGEGNADVSVWLDGKKLSEVGVNVKAIQQEITVLLDGNQVKFDQPPVMINDRVMVPIRAVAEKMGDTVKWSEKDNSALIIHPDRMVVFKNNHNSVVIAKEPEFDKWEHYDLDVPAQIVGSRTLTPIRAIGECLGAKVEWDGETQTVKITSSKSINKTITDEKVTKFNVYYSLTLKDNLFAEFSPEIKEFYESRNDWADSFIIWWDDWFLGVDNLISGEKNNVYMIKKCLAELFSELPDNKEINMSTEIEITNWLSTGLSYLSYVDFTKIDKVVNISPHTANALSKFGNALDKVGLKLELTGVTFESVCKMLSDYTIGITYIDLIRETLKDSNINDDVFYEALDSLEKEYTNKIVNALAAGAKDGVIAFGKFAIGTATGGLFSLASFSKDTINAIAGYDDIADAVKNIHCIYWFNEYIDNAELSIRTDAYTAPKKIDDYIKVFNFQKTIKKKLYQSMDMLKNSKDEYTVNRIQEQLNKIDNMSYIVWK